MPPGTGDIALSLVQTVPLTGAVVVSTPSDVSLQDARKAIEMFRQMKVDVVGVVENMSYFVCPHCSHEVDIFSRGGAEMMAKQFEVPFLGNIALDPEVRKSGDGGKPVVLEGENSPHAKSIYEFAHKVIDRVDRNQSERAGERDPDPVVVETLLATSLPAAFRKTATVIRRPAASPWR